MEDRDDSKEIERAIENSLFWIGQAAGGHVPASILLNYFTAIETLIIGRRKTNTIVQDLARRLPILVGHTEEEKKRIVQELKKTGGSYDLRGEITHSGVSEVEDKKKIFDTGALAAWTVLRFLKARGFKSLDQAIESLDIVARSMDNVPEKSLDWKRLGKNLLRYLTGAK